MELRRSLPEPPQPLLTAIVVLTHRASVGSSHSLTPSSVNVFAVGQPINARRKRNAKVACKVHARLLRERAELPAPVHRR